MTGTKALLTIAWRNLWRHTRRTILTVSTISLGLMLLLFSLGLNDGSHQQLVESAVRMGSGHVVVQKEGYLQSGGIERLLSASEAERIERWFRAQSGRFPIQNVVRRAFASGLASSADDAAAVQIIGIDPDLERKASRFAEKVIQGTFPERTDSSRIVVGQGVARKLEIEVGERVVLTAQVAGSGEIESRLVQLGAVMATGLEEFDETAVLLPLQTAQDFFKLGSGCHQVAVILESARLSENLALHTGEEFPGLEVLTWAEAMPELADFIRIDDAGNYLFFSMIFLLIAFLVLNTLLMSVLERRREFALLDALGLSPGRRFQLVMSEAVMIALFSSLIGTALGYGCHLYLAHYGLALDLFYSEGVTAAGVAFDPVIYSALSLRRILGAILVIFVMTLVLALLPARRAAVGANPHLLGGN